MVDIRFWPYNEPEKFSRHTARMRGFALGTILGFGALGFVGNASAQTAPAGKPNLRYVGTRIIDGLPYRILEDENKVVYIEPEKTTRLILESGVDANSPPRIVYAKYSSKPTDTEEQVQILRPGERSLIEYDYSARLNDQKTLVENNFAAYYATADAKAITSESTAGKVRAIGRRVMAEVEDIGDNTLNPHRKIKKPHPHWRLLKNIVLLPVRIAEMPYRAVHFARKGSVLNSLHVPNRYNGDSVIVRHYNRQENLDELIAYALNQGPVPAPLFPETTRTTLTAVLEPPPMEKVELPTYARPFYRTAGIRKPRRPAARKFDSPSLTPPKKTTLLLAGTSTPHQEPGADPGALSFGLAVAGVGLYAARRRRRAYSPAFLSVAPASDPPPEAFPANENTFLPELGERAAKLRAGFTRAALEIETRARKIAPHVAAFAAGAGVRWGTKAGLTVLAKFALAAAATTIPVAAAPAALLAAGLVAGSIAGGASSLVVAAIRGQGKERDEHWKRKAFLQGMAFGAIGAGVADYFQADGLLHHLFRGHAAALTAHGTAPVAHVSVAAHVAIPSPKDLLTRDQFRHLPAALRKLAESKNSADMAQFCDEASSRLALHHHSPAALKAAVALMRRGVELAPQNQHLQANLAYMELWGKGTAQNIPDALRHARLADHAVHNYGARALRAASHLFCRTPAPV